MLIGLISADLLAPRHQLKTLSDNVDKRAFLRLFNENLETEMTSSALRCPMFAASETQTLVSFLAMT